MAEALRKVDLMLERALIERLKEEAEHRRVSVSELVSSLLSRDLGLPQTSLETAERIRKLRRAKGAMPDSAALIRESRDHGW